MNSMLNRKLRTNKEQSLLTNYINKLNNSKTLSEEEMQNLFLLLFAYMLVTPALLVKKLEECRTDVLKKLLTILREQIVEFQEKRELKREILSDLKNVVSDKEFVRNTLKHPIFQRLLFKVYCEKHNNNLKEAWNDFSNLMKTFNVRAVIYPFKQKIQHLEQDFLQINM